MKDIISDDTILLGIGLAILSDIGDSFICLSDFPETNKEIINLTYHRFNLLRIYLEKILNLEVTDCFGKGVEKIIMIMGSNRIFEF